MYNVRIEDPITCIGICLSNSLLSLGPVVLDLLDEGVFGANGTVLGLVALEREVRLELRCFPAVVRSHDLVVPVLLDEVFEIFPICGSGMWDVVVRQPSLKLRLVPLVVN